MPTLTVNGTARAVPLGGLLSDALGPCEGPGLPCGGLGICGKCRVMAHGALSAPTQEELRLLTPDDLAGGVRLACRARVLGDAQVSTAQTEALDIQTEGAQREGASEPLFRQYGAAVDVGTTTLAARLHGAGGLLAQAAMPNPQARFGADVLTRVGWAMGGGMEDLSRCIRDAVAALLLEMAAAAGIGVEEIDALVITGNTAMLYLLTGRDPEPLAHAPFLADTLFDVTLTGRALDLPCSGTQVYLPPCISSFVGADVVTALLASGICTGPDTALLADIGTNGEMALWHGGRLTCCSTAAGPAFEGAGLSMGMPGRAGAIDHISVQAGALRAHTIGNTAPVGLCGSGAIDALAALLATDQMDDTGSLGGAQVVLAPPVALTQKDVRMLQLAKSAVRAGLEALLNGQALSHAQVQTLAVAGGFGSYLDVHSAAAIGLIPPDLEDRTRILGNAALAGASMLLRSAPFLAEARALVAEAAVLDLNQNTFFSHNYVEYMMF